MASPDKQSTFSSARTAPRSAPVSHRRASVPSETAIQLTGQDKMMSPDKSAKRQVNNKAIKQIKQSICVYYMILGDILAGNDNVAFTRKEIRISSGYRFQL